MNENIEILQRQFDAYCTKVLKYASISYYHANRRRTEHEVSFSSLLSRGQHRRPLPLYGLPFPSEGMACRSTKRAVRTRHRTPYTVQTGNHLTVFFLRL